MEQETGFEPARCPAWKADAQPLSHSCIMEAIEGIEPSRTDYKSAILPLNYIAMFKVVIRAGTFSTTTNEWLFIMVRPPRIELGCPD